MSSSAPSRSAGEQAKTLWGFGFGRLLCYGWMDGWGGRIQSIGMPLGHSHISKGTKNKTTSDRPTDRPTRLLLHAFNRPIGSDSGVRKLRLSRKKLSSTLALRP